MSLFELATFVVAVVAAGVLVAQRVGWISAGPVAESAQRRANEAEEELEHANLTIAAQRVEIVDLKRTRELTPILELQADVLAQLASAREQDAQILDRLVTINGSLGKVREGLDLAVEGLRLVTGMVMSDVAVPSRNPRA